jgi:hypothetical protein
MREKRITALGVRGFMGSEGAVDVGSEGAVDVESEGAVDVEW